MGQSFDGEKRVALFTSLLMGEGERRSDVERLARCLHVLQETFCDRGGLRVRGLVTPLGVTVFGLRFARREDADTGSLERIAVGERVQEEVSGRGRAFQSRQKVRDPVGRGGFGGVGVSRQQLRTNTRSKIPRRQPWILFPARDDECVEHPEVRFRGVLRTLSPKQVVPLLVEGLPRIVQVSLTLDRDALRIRLREDLARELFAQPVGIGPQLARCDSTASPALRGDQFGQMTEQPVRDRGGEPAAA